MTKSTTRRGKQGEVSDKPMERGIEEHLDKSRNALGAKVIE